MRIRSEKSKKTILFIGDLILILLAVYLAVFLRSGTSVNILVKYTGATTFSTSVYLLGFYIFDFYKLDLKFKSIFYSVTFAVGIVAATSTISMVFYSFPSWKFGRGIFLINMVFISLFTYSWRLVFLLIFSAIKPRVIVILGAGDSGKTIYNVVNNSDDFMVKGFLDDNVEKQDTKIGKHSVLGKSTLLPGLAEQDEIDAAVIAITHEKSSEFIKAVMNAKVNGVEIYDMPSLYEELTGKLPVKHIEDIWVVSTPFQGMVKSAYTAHIKKIIDKGLSCALLILSFPVIIITAIAIKLDSKGPVFFRQKRMGLNGKVYDMVKFRSMVKNAEPDGAVWAHKNDIRTTGVGRIIRKMRIDEIPQMWNVLVGEMSFIGPRPERPEFVESLTAEIPFYSLRHTVRPGVTGWAQINYSYGSSKEDALEKLQYDLFYIKNLSPLLDLHIIFKTIKVVLLGIGAR
ncbi:MAG: sugar transferase [Thermodesulfobacteriota bacterium]|nr:sugar transferase [Thermodesulfobacteriota bacterium]